MEALEVARQVGARKTYFTHISHQLGCHAEVEEELPEGVHLAWDGLQIVSEGPAWNGLKGN